MKRGQELMKQKLESNQPKEPPMAKKSVSRSKSRKKTKSAKRLMYCQASKAKKPIEPKLTNYALRPKETQLS